MSQRDILNDFYSTIITKRHDSITTACALVESLLRFGMNHLTVDYYFAILTLAHTFSLNRQEAQEAEQIETYMAKYLSIHKNKGQTA